MKDLLKNIWNKIKEYKTPALSFIVCILLTCFDLIFNFSIAKCITYIVMLFCVLMMIIYYIKLMSIADDVLKKIDNKDNEK